MTVALRVWTGIPRSWWFGDQEIAVPATYCSGKEYAEIGLLLWLLCCSLNTQFGHFETGTHGLQVLELQGQCANFTRLKEHRVNPIKLERDCEKIELIRLKASNPFLVRRIYSQVESIETLVRMSVTNKSLLLKFKIWISKWNFITRNPRNRLSSIHFLEQTQNFKIWIKKMRHGLKLSLTNMR